MFLGVNAYPANTPGRAKIIDCSEMVVMIGISIGQLRKKNFAKENNPTDTLIQQSLQSAPSIRLDDILYSHGDSQLLKKGIASYV